LGWLEPLLDLLQKDPNTVAVPHYDLVHDPVSLAYKKTSDFSVATFSWNLAVRMRNATELPITNRRIASPVLRGNAFAVRKELLVSLGGYDVSTLLEDGGGGEHIELSLRIWLCGGSIKVWTHILDSM